MTVTANNVFQEYISSALREERLRQFSQSDQLSLGKLIEKLEKIVETNKKDGEVVFDFEYLHPTKFISWRGSYSELSLAFEDGDTSRALKVSAFLQLCKETIGATFQGYKGGDFVMTAETPVWVANYGNSGNTALIDVIDKGYTVVLMTGWREY